jgi:hypothetical protein
VSLDSPFFVLYVFVLCLVPNIACVSGFSILCFVCLRSVSCAQYCLCLWIVHFLVLLLFSVTFIYLYISDTVSFFCYTYCVMNKDNTIFII